MFKRLKQNFPLKYFLGDNQNAIEIQIWVSLICQLILLIVQRTAEKRWAFSNMASVIRYHLMTYINLFKFLKSPKANYVDRSEERRVGKECRSRWSVYHCQEKDLDM